MDKVLEVFPHAKLTEAGDYRVHFNDFFSGCNKNNIRFISGPARATVPTEYTVTFLDPEWQGYETLDCVVLTSWPGKASLATALEAQTSKRPERRNGETIGSIDERLNAWRDHMRSKVYPKFNSDIVAFAEGFGLRFVMTEFRGDYREAVLSVPLEATPAQVEALCDYARKRAPEGIQVRSVVFPYK